MAMDRVMGIETEYGISRRSASTKNIYAEQHQISDTRSVITCYVAVPVRWDYSGETELPKERRAETIDNALLPNGSRFYDDHGHPELSTPECRTPRQLVVYDKAGERILNVARMRANEELHRHQRTKGDDIAIYKNNVDRKGNSFGCHENYLMDRRTPWDRIREMLMPFLVTRQIFTGAGKVGINCQQGSLKLSYESLKKYITQEFEELGSYLAQAGLSARHDSILSDIRRLLEDYENQAGTDEVPAIYQLSQRPDFFTCEEGLQTTHDRPLINTRDEPHADPEKYRRLHVIAGDANLAPWSAYLKVGTTMLVLDLIEDGFIGDEVCIRDPVNAFKTISRDQDWQWGIAFADGRSATAIDLQELYLGRAKQHYSRDPMKSEVIRRWEYILDALKRQDTAAVSDKLDHAIKKRLLDEKARRSGGAMPPEEAHKIDLRYHSISPDEGVFYALQKRGFVDSMGIDEAEVEHAVHHPPEDTRAYFRGECFRRYPDDVVSANWDFVNMKRGRELIQIPLAEPLRGTRELNEEKFNRSATARELLEKL